MLPSFLESLMSDRIHIVAVEAKLHGREEMTRLMAFTSHPTWDQLDEVLEMEFFSPLHGKNNLVTVGSIDKLGPFRDVNVDISEVPLIGNPGIPVVLRVERPQLMAGVTDDNIPKNGQRRLVREISSDLGAKRQYKRIAEMLEDKEKLTGEDWAFMHRMAENIEQYESSKIKDHRQRKLARSIKTKLSRAESSR